MRWNPQSIDKVAESRLPGFLEPAVERHFEAPEAMDRTFYEVRAKSALNRVPKGSNVPFKWTINPYRGCTHACTYCAVGETPVLLADGRTRPLAELRVGDAIYGTHLRGAERRYVRTRVLAHWSTRRRAVRTTLADGTSLVTSGDHRFLTERGWKHIADATGGARRSHLTTSDRLLGVGRFAAPPVHDEAFRLGYVRGIARGDRDRLGLARADGEALRRARAYLPAASALAHEFEFAAEGPGRAARAIRRPAADAVAEWPDDPGESWKRGFLSGRFDAGGGWSGTAVRICDTDPERLRRTDACLWSLGFHTTIDRSGDDGCHAVRLLGGLPESVRFLHTTDPAVTRKRDIEGLAVGTQGDLGVESVEDLGVVVPMFDITTGTGDFIADGVVSHNCFARPTHEFLDMDAGRDFERRIVVKVNVPEVLRAELARPSWQREHVALGTNTDPYQWVEGRYQLMRGIWEALRDARNPCSILTKSPLVLRDVDLLKEIAEVADVGACLSVPTLDEKAWRASEPGTPNPRARLEAVAELNRQGIPTGILISPLMPGINDAPEQVEKIIELATEAGAVYIGGNTLFLRGPVRRIFFDWLRSYRPDLVPRYKQLYGRGGSVAESERRHIEHAAGLPGGRLEPYPDRFKHKSGAGHRGRATDATDAPTPRRGPEPAQAALF